MSSKDIKTKPATRTPRTMDKSTRIPKELVRRGIDSAKNQAGQEPDNTPENYATDKVQEGMYKAAHETGESAIDTAGRVKDQIGKRIKERKQNVGVPCKSTAGADTVGNAGPKASKEQAHHRSTESGKRRVQQMARERRAMRGTGTIKPVTDISKAATKTTSKGTVKTAKKSVKSTQRSVKASGNSVKTVKRTAKTAAKTAKQTAKASQQAIRAAKATAKAAAAAARATAKAVATGIKLSIAAVKGLIALIAAGGWVVLLVMLIIAAVAAIFSSPSGILVGGGADGTPTIAEAVRTINEEMYEKVEQIQSQHGDAKEVHISYNGDEGGTYVEHWIDVLGVFAVKCNLDPNDPQDVLVMDESRMNLLRQVFWDMVSITSKTEEREASPNPVASPAPSVSSAPTLAKDTILFIAVNSKSYTEMAGNYHFTDEQVEALNALMEPDMRKMLLELLTLDNADLMLTPQEIAAIEANLPPDLSPSRRVVVLTAHSLVGKVNYFWGGKSETIGWDTRWGTPKVVTSGGSPTTGTTRPFGMDCSGFVTWTFINAAQDKSVAGIIGHGTANQFPKSTAITWEEAQPGDLAFFSPPGGSNHVGIVVGRNTDGSLMICHCSSSKNNVVVSEAVKGKTSFKYIRRPDAYYAIYP